MYDNVFIVGPCWWGTYPMPMFTCLEGLDFTGKNVFACMTHEGSGMGNSEHDLKKILKGASFGKSLAVAGHSVAQSENKIQHWADSCSKSVRRDLNMNDFTFQNPTKIYFGRNQINHLPEEIEKVSKNVLLVYGGDFLKKTGLYDKVVNVLHPAGITTFDLDSVEPNPHHTTVNAGAKICRDTQNWCGACHWRRVCDRCCKSNCRNSSQ
jgi:hypothetical protein